MLEMHSLGAKLGDAARRHTQNERERDLHCSPFLNYSNRDAPARLQDGGPSQNSAICDCVGRRMFLSELSLSLKDPVPGCF